MTPPSATGGSVFFKRDRYEASTILGAQERVEPLVFRKAAAAILIARP